MRQKAQITLEMSIVFPLIMMVIASLIFVTLYLHDVAVLDSYTYSGMVEAWCKDKEVQKEIERKTNKASLFLLNPTVSINEGIDNYSVKVLASGNSQIKWMSKFLKNFTYKKEMKVVKRISIEKMYVYKSIVEGIRKQN